MNEIALLIPCYNEENRLKIQPIKEFVKENEGFIDFYFIDDGSVDNTRHILSRELVDNKCSFLIKWDKNLGKGNAIREGVNILKAKNYKYFAFIDADLEIPLVQIIRLYEEIKDTDKFLAISQRQLNKNLNYRNFRSILSVCMVEIANRIIRFKPYIRDTQCGCKLFKIEVVEICFGEPFISNWLFDIEIFLRLKNKLPNAREKISEVSLSNLTKSEGKSNFQFIQNLKLFKDLLMINRLYN